MLNNISWAGYTYAVIIILLVYYISVLVFFFRNDLKGLFLKKQNYMSSGGGIPKDFLQFEGEKMGHDLPEWDDEEIHQLLMKLQLQINKAAARKFPKEELLLSLQLVLRDFPNLKESHLRNNVNNFLKSEVQNNCSIHLSDDEVALLWGVEVGGAS